MSKSEPRALLERAAAIERDSPEQALALVDEALAGAEAQEAPCEVAEARIARARTLALAGRLKEAMAEIERAGALAECTGKGPLAARLEREKGFVFASIGSYDEAFESLSRALERAEAEGLRDEAFKTRLALGELSADIGDHGAALDYLMRCYSEAEDGAASDRDKALVLANIGVSFKAQGNTAAAFEYFQEALALAGELRDTIIKAELSCEMGGLYLHLGELDKAEEYYEAALEAGDRLDNAAFKARALQDLARLSHFKGLNRQALVYSAMAVELSASLESKKLRSELWKLKSQVNAALGNWQDAYADLRRAQEYGYEWNVEEAERRLRNLRFQHEIETARREAQKSREEKEELERKSLALQGANRKLERVAIIGTRITSSLKPRDLVVNLAESLKGLMDIYAIGVGALDGGGKGIEVPAFMVDGEILPPFRVALSSASSVAAACVRECRPIIYDARAERALDFPGEPSAGGKDLKAESVLYFPLVVKNQAIGFFTLQSERPMAYDNDVLGFVSSLVPFIAIAVANARMMDELSALNEELVKEKRDLEKAADRIEQLANHDNLTGLPNRRLLFELLTQSFPVASRLRRKVAVLYMDLDDFKPINDQYGHAVGDAALIAVAKLISKAIRSSDTVARVGGDEFIAFLTNIARREDAERVARKLLEGFQKPIKVGQYSFKLGISLGIAIYPDDATEIEALINLADEAMYGVKRGGKSGYAFAREPFVGLPSA
jgi:diguanylate cyclase (GGDEF)-like protein